MDKAEELAEQYLRSNFRSVLYEPDGNIPPDFLVEGRIAVEVRRLNQNEFVSGKKRGLEEDSIPLVAKITKLLDLLGQPMDGRSYWVSFRFRRPFLKWKILKRQVHEALSLIKDADNDNGKVFEFERNFKIEIRPATSALTHRFVLASYVDHNSGGWIFEEMKKNIELCIDEKAEKIASYRSCYPEWWLILIDFIGYGLNEFDQGLFNENVKITHPFDRLILIDPRNHLRTMVVPSSE